MSSKDKKLNKEYKLRDMLDCFRELAWENCKEVPSGLPIFSTKLKSLDSLMQKQFKWKSIETLYKQMNKIGASAFTDVFFSGYFSSKKDKSTMFKKAKKEKNPENIIKQTLYEKGKKAALDGLMLKPTEKTVNGATYIADGFVQTQDLTSNNFLSGYFANLNQIKIYDIKTETFTIGSRKSFDGINTIGIRVNNISFLGGNVFDEDGAKLESSRQRNQKMLQELRRHEETEKAARDVIRKIERKKVLKPINMQVQTALSKESDRGRLTDEQFLNTSFTFDKTPRDVGLDR